MQQYPGLLEIPLFCWRQSAHTQILMLSSVLLVSQYSFPCHPSFFGVNFSPCSVGEVPDEFTTFHFSLCFQPSAEPPQLHICQNLSIDTTGSPPNPRSTWMHHKRACKICHIRLKWPHWVGRSWRDTNMISWKLWPTTAPLEGIVQWYWGEIGNIIWISPGSQGKYIRTVRTCSENSWIWRVKPQNWITILVE